MIRFRRNSKSSAVIRKNFRIQFEDAGLSLKKYMPFLIDVLLENFQPNILVVCVSLFKVSTCHYYKGGSGTFSMLHNTPIHHTRKPLRHIAGGWEEQINVSATGCVDLLMRHVPAACVNGKLPLVDYCRINLICTQNSSN